MPVASCPVQGMEDRYYRVFGTSYGGGRAESNHDLDGHRRYYNDALSVSEIEDCTKQIVISEMGAFLRAVDADEHYQTNNHGNLEYPLSFVDGHCVPGTRIIPGSGLNHSRNIFDYDQKPY